MKNKFIPWLKDAWPYLLIGFALGTLLVQGDTKGFILSAMLAAAVGALLTRGKIE